MTAKLAIETRRLLHQKTFYVSSLWQPPGMFCDNGRKLKRVAEEGDPWIAQIFYPDDPFSEEGAHALWPAFIEWGRGMTADEAVLDALRKADGLQGRFRRLATSLSMLEGGYYDNRNRLEAA